MITLKARTPTRFVRTLQASLVCDNLIASFAEGKAPHTAAALEVAGESSLAETVFNHELDPALRIAALRQILPADVEGGWRQAGENLIFIDSAVLTASGFAAAAAANAEREIAVFLDHDPVAGSFGTQRDSVARNAAAELLLEFESRRARTGLHADPQLRPFEYRLLLSDLFDSASWLEAEPHEEVQAVLFSRWIAGLIVLDIPTKTRRYLVSLHRFLEGSQPSPGSGTVVLRGSKVLETRTFGYADLEQKIPVDPGLTLFDLASMSKVFTALAVLQLVDRGKVDLAQSIVAYLNGLPASMSAVTVHHLLQQRSGLIDDFNILEALNRQSVGVGNSAVLDACQLYWSKSSPFEFFPGSQYGYCNLNCILLAELVAGVSGRAFNEYLRTEIFAPLGMNSTLLADADFVPPTGCGYTVEQEEYVCSSNLSVTAGDGRVFSTLQDMASWHSCVGSGALTKLLSTASISVLTATAHPDGRYGAGLRVDPASGLFGHSGWDVHGTGLSLFMPGESSFSIIFLSKAAERKSRFAGEAADETRAVGRAIAAGWRPATDIGDAIRDF